MIKLIQLLIYLAVHFVFSQATLKGEILDAETSKPLAYVNIGIANKSVGTVSNAQGNFKLQLYDRVSSKDTIVFSHIGYAPRAIPVSVLKNNKVTIKLEPLETRLEEVVVQYKAPKAKKWDVKAKDSV